MIGDAAVQLRITRHIVAVEALPRLETMVGEHNRRVDKLAKRHHIEIAHATFRTLRTFQGQRIPADIGSGDWKFVSPVDASDSRTVRFWVEVEVSGQRAMISGWEIVASLTLTDVGGYLLSPVSGTVSEYVSYRDRGGICDHCRTSRPRSVTYLLRKGDEIKQVGSKCLKDFTGHMLPSAWAAYADSLAGFKKEISGLEDEEDAFGDGSRIVTAVAIPEYLPFVRMAIRLHGWLSRSKVRVEGGVATADAAWEMMIRRSGELSEEDRRKSFVDLELVADTLLVKEDREDYEEHLMTVINQGYVFARNIGLVASICSASDRIRRDIAQVEVRKNEVSEWFGEVGKRGVFTLKVVHTQSFDSRFGLSHLHIFIDGGGRKAKWFSSGICLEKATYEIKATVKKHEVYEDRKETLLSRCKVVRKCKNEQLAQEGA